MPKEWDGKVLTNQQPIRLSQNCREKHQYQASSCVYRLTTRLGYF